MRLPFHAGSPWRNLALAGLLAWVLALSLETLFRPGGYSDEQGLPSQLTRDGLVLRRLPASAAAAPLPAGVVLLEAADYGTAPGRPLVLLRRVSLVSSGTGVNLPLDAITASLAGKGSRGRCVRLGPDGSVLEAQASADAWFRHQSGRRPESGAIVAWLAGWRPYRSNTCLWEGRRTEQT